MACGAAFCFALGFYWAGLGADVITTEQALDRPGIEEMNPALGDHPSDSRLVATALVGGAATTWLAKRAYQKHPKTTVGVLVGLGALHVALAKHNNEEER